ncbi:MAG: hypothetical protein N3G22_04360 [Candidatus Micrarchaeota archaeon]|nr:hypothetical protein [Candidatus Micrarchaeota archaeon]
MKNKSGKAVQLSIKFPGEKKLPPNLSDEYIEKYIKRKGVLSEGIMKEKAFSTLCNNVAEILMERAELLKKYLLKIHFTTPGIKEVDAMLLALERSSSPNAIIKESKGILSLSGDLIMRVEDEKNLRCIRKMAYWARTYASALDKEGRLYSYLIEGRVKELIEAWEKIKKRKDRSDELILKSSMASRIATLKMLCMLDE